MRPDLHALSLALLLFAPAAWFAVHGSLPVVPTERRPRRWSFVLFALMTASVGTSLALELASLPSAPAVRVTAMTALALAFALLLTAPRVPLAGPVSYALLSYTFPREHTVTEALLAVGTMPWVTALSVAAVVLAAARGSRPPAADRGLLLAVALFAGWLALSVLAAVLTGRPLEPDLVGRTGRYVQAVLLFLVAAAARPTLRECQGAVLLVGGALAARYLWLTSVTFNEQNLAMLVSITAPLALTLSVATPRHLIAAPLAMLGVYLAGLVPVSQNRGAFLAILTALVATAATLLPARWRRRGLAGVTIVVVVGLVAAGASGLLSRFDEVYVGGRFVGTAAERLDLWAAGWRLGLDYWLFGVGPGNFEHFVGPYLDREINNPHNSFVELLSETGFAGLLLYAGVAAMTLRRLLLTAQAADGWRRPVAAGLVGSVSAHLVAGLFLSNPSLVWTWTLLGVAAAVAAAPQPRPPTR